VGTDVGVRILLLAALLAASRSAGANDASGEDSDLELAKAHFRTGEIDYDKGLYDAAAREFDEAYRLSRRPELLYNMGKAYDGAGDPTRALSAYRRYLEQVPQGAGREFVETRIAALVAVVAHLTVRAAPADARLLVDGRAAAAGELEVNPGAHLVELGAEGYATRRERVVLLAGESQTLDLALKSLVRVVQVAPPRTPVYKRWWLWTLVGAAVVGGVTAGVVVGVQRAQQVDEPASPLPAVVR
jgi:tetratricopeptide (TPR) repeat protein